METHHTAQRGRNGNAMNTDSRIYVAGHRGLVGSALMRCLVKNGYTDLVTRTHQELDLMDQHAVEEFFNKEKPEYVFLAAAKVGGIMANSNYPAEFIHNNIIIQDNLIHQAWCTGVKRLMFLGSSCIYPKKCPQPIKEDYLLTGPLEFTNRPYAVAKIAGIETCWAYNRQYGTEFMAVMPTNMYGPGDNYDLETSHVLPAIIKKMHDAMHQGLDSVTLWGTGNALREFLYSDDMADACLFLMNLHKEDRIIFNRKTPPLVNIGSGTDLSIKELAEKVKRIIGFQGEIHWDTTKPDGTPRKLLDTGRLSRLGWHYSTELDSGIAYAYQDFLAHHA